MHDELAFEKRFYERFWALHRNETLVSLYKEFGAEVFRRSSVLEGFCDFLDRTDFRGKACIEIGSFRGVTAAILSKRFQIVYSVDILEDPMRHKVAEFLALDNVFFFVAKDNEEKAWIISQLPHFDAAYVDGDHENDARFDFELVKRSGRVLFHEYWDAQPAVMSLVDSLPGSVETDGKKLALWTA